MSEPDEPAPDAAESAPRELRAKDVLVVRTEAELDALEASLGDAERAELSQWFARPSREVVEERKPASSGGGGLQIEGSDADLEREYAERQVRIIEASKHIEPSSIALVERHAQVAAGFLREIVPPAPFVDESIFQIRIPSPSEDAQIGELRQYSRDEATEDYLTEAVPQAVLRDLYRAESHFQVSFTSPFFGEDEAPPEDPWVEIRTVMHEKRPLPPPLDTYKVGEQARHEFRSLIAGSWADKVAAVKASREGE